MIVFDGFLTGSANKYFINKIINYHNVFFVSLIVLSLPFWIFLSIKTNTFFEVMSAVCFFGVSSPIMSRFCVSKKERRSINLKKVSINDEIITAVSEKKITSNKIKDVKKVKDFGEFYYLVFPRKYFVVYICQKNLLTKGTLEEFEALFEDKIVRVTVS